MRASAVRGDRGEPFVGRGASLGTYGEPALHLRGARRDGSGVMTAPVPAGGAQFGKIGTMGWASAAPDGTGTKT
jgi:hypothetical protein